MNILHLVNHLNTGGITAYVKTLAREQIKAGHKVVLWGARGTASAELKAIGVTVIDQVPSCKSELSPRLWFMLPKLMHVLTAYKMLS